MADDSKAFSAQQGAHAANIRAERHVMQQLGFSREGARVALRSFRRTMLINDMRGKAEVAQASTPPRPLPKIETEITAFNLRPMTLAGVEGTNGGSLNQQEPFSMEGDWREFTDCDGNTFDAWIRDFTAAP